MSIFTAIRDALDKEAKTMTAGIGRGISHVYASQFNRVVVNGISLEVSDGIIRLYTDDKPYKIVVDGEIVRR